MRWRWKYSYEDEEMHSNFVWTSSKICVACNLTFFPISVASESSFFWISSRGSDQKIQINNLFFFFFIEQRNRFSNWPWKSMIDRSRSYILKFWIIDFLKPNLVIVGELRFLSNKIDMYRYIEQSMREDIDNILKNWFTKISIRIDFCDHYLPIFQRI